MKTNNHSVNFILLAIATSIPAFVACVELMGINVALHAIGKTFHADHAMLAWVLTAYILTNASFYIFLGRVSDHIGHRNMLLIGCFSMAFWSLLGSFAGDFIFLIVVRALQGLSSASIILSSLSLLKSEIDNNQKGLLTLWSSVSGMGMATGPFIGGVLVKLFGWQGIFYWGFLLSLVSLVMVWCCIPKQRKTTQRFSADCTGALLLFTFIVAVMTLLTLQSSLPKIAVLIAWITAPSSLILFFIQQHHQRSPLLEFSLLRKPYYLLATLAGGALYYALYSYLFVFSLYFQKLGWSSLKTGVYLTITPIVFFITTYFVGKSVTFERCKLFFQWGSVIGAISFLFLMLGDQASATGYLLGAIFFGVAYACYSQPSLFLVSQESQQSNVGVGMGMLFTLRWVAGNFGVFVSAMLMKSGHSNNFNVINPCLVVLAIFSITGMMTTWIYQKTNTTYET